MIFSPSAWNLAVSTEYAVGPWGQWSVGSRIRTERGYTFLPFLDQRPLIPVMHTGKEAST